MNTKRFIFLYALTLLFSCFVFSQEKTWGDTAVVQHIHKMLSAIYDQKDTTLFFLTSQNLTKPRSVATNMVVYEKNNKINRIVTSSTTTEGILSQEYYLDNGVLLFVYQTMEYFEESKTGNETRNFKGLKSWESRYYLVDEKLKFQKNLGYKESHYIYETQDLLAEKSKFLKFIISHVK